MRSAACVLVIAACSCGSGHAAGDGASAGDAAGDAADGTRSSVAVETANNTGASAWFVDDYHNYNTTSQTGNSNGDVVAGPSLADNLSRGAISKLPLTSLLPGVQHVLVATQ